MAIFVKRFYSYIIFIALTSSGVSTFAAGARYAVLVDAGSTFSRAHVFEYVQSPPQFPLPAIKDIFSQSSTPPLASFASNPAAAGASLKTILDAAAATLQSKGVDLTQVPVRVFGTAGMRLLTAAQQAAIYANVVSYLRSNYSFSLKPQNVQTITGVMEGLYGWLDVNYLANNFLNPSVTVGSIDMGGASTQIAFATNDQSMPANEIPLYINKTHYRVFSQSFLGLGTNQAMTTMNSNPAVAACYPRGYDFRSGTGNFSFTTCAAVYATIIQNNPGAQNMISTQGSHFFAYNGIYFNYLFFNILQDPSQSALQAQIQTVCTQSWTTLQAEYSNDSFLADYCANGSYFNDLLYNTYQLQDSQLSVVAQINSTSLDWTLGALLYSLVQ